MPGMKCRECGGKGRIELLTSSRPCLACKPDAIGLTEPELEEYFTRIARGAGWGGDFPAHAPIAETMRKWADALDAAIMACAGDNFST
jgi:hypothetical protein